MQAIAIAPDGRLSWSATADPPAPVEGEVLVEVAAAGVNRADLLQRAGHYPPPPGASAILGMECAGTVSAVGPGVTAWRIGDRVCSLLAGGGYAELAVVPAGHCLPVPDRMTLTDAAALPEAVCTAWSNLSGVGRLAAGEVALIHGGAGGVGTVALQVARLLGAGAVVTTARAEHADRLVALGATGVVDYNSGDFVEAMRELGGADVVLDVLGAAYLARNLEALAVDGRLVVIGLQTGRRAEADLGLLLAKRASVAATTLRNRSAAFKAALIEEIRLRCWEPGGGPAIRPVVARVLPVERAGDAHAMLEAGGHLGKVVLQVRDVR
jgi:putative PIG3 family NAD(P)H quinone oxidoreductase